MLMCHYTSQACPHVRFLGMLFLLELLNTGLLGTCVVSCYPTNFDAIERKNGGIYNNIILSLGWMNWLCSLNLCKFGLQILYISYDKQWNLRLYSSNMQESNQHPTGDNQLTLWAETKCKFLSFVLMYHGPTGVNYPRRTTWFDRSGPRIGSRTLQKVQLRQGWL